MKRSLILLVGLILGVGQMADAQVENLPTPGQTKTEYVHVYRRIKDSKSKEVFDVTHQVPEGWVIVSTTVGSIVDGVFHPHVVSRLGSTGGPDVSRIRDAGHVLSREEINQGYKEVLDMLAKYLAQEEGSEGQKEKKQQALDLQTKIGNEFNSHLVRYNEVGSSHEAVHVTAWAQCQWKDTPFKVWYTAGGKIDAHVKIDLMYIGTPDYMRQRIEKFKAEIAQVVK